MKGVVPVAWTDDLMRSMNTFDRLIKPVLHEMVKGKFIRVEGTAEEIAKILDEQIGIDAMINNNGLFYGLGSRIQIDSGVWDTFTIRCNRESNHITELEKLRKAIKFDAMRPYITMQAYVEDDCLKSIGVALTRDIVDYIDNHNCKKKVSRDGNGWAQFVVIPWDEMKKAGYKVKTKRFMALKGVG